LSSNTICIIVLIKMFDFSKVSLAVTYKEKTIFTSTSNWLHPLFELDQFLLKNSYSREELVLYDKIVGKAAAMLTVRLGLKRVHAGVMSVLAEEVFVRFGVAYSCGARIDRIQCATEDSLKNVDDPEEAVLILKRRAGGKDESALIIESLYIDRGGKQVITNLSMALRSGGRLIIRGANGSGKTTLLQSILGILPPRKGLIHITGVDTLRQNRTGGRKLIGYMNQESVQSDLPISAYEVVAIGTAAENLPRQERKRRIMHAMETTGSAHLRQRLFSELSGGEKQRVSLARCLAQNPKLILLDEPTAHLDPDAKQETMHILRDSVEKTGLTVVMVTHEESWHQLTDWRHRVLDKGRLFPADGAPVV
jgi:ABC-type Mn2+/Zn2+ transport system ATPase subunit